MPCRRNKDTPLFRPNYRLKIASFAHLASIKSA